MVGERKMLRHVRITRFKNLQDITIQLERVNVLVGSNNSGKSSILHAIQFAVSVSQTTSLEKNRWEGERLPTSLSPTQLIYSPLRDVTALAPGGILREPIEHAIEIEFEEIEENNRTIITVRKGRNKNIVTAITGKALGQKLQKIEEPYSIFVPGLAGIPSVEEYKTPGIIRKAAARGDANNVFRNVLWLLRKEDDDWKKFCNDLKCIFPNLSIDVTFDPERDEYINAQIILDGQRLPIDAAGTGVLQAIQILSYVNVYKPKLLILDEPDSHLHPNNQRNLATMLIRLAEEREFQVIISTHSRHLLNQLSTKAKIHWVRDGEIVRADYDEVDVLMDIGALDKGDLLMQGNIKCVLLTEDSDITPIKTLMEASGFIMDEVDVWPYSGCTNVGTALVLAAFIRKHAAATKILVHRDRDYLTNDEVNDYVEKLRRANIECFITVGTDVESHFLSAEHVNNLYSQIATERVNELLSQATRNTEDKSKKKFINSRTQMAKKMCRQVGAEPNNGEIAMEAINSYEQDISRYRHGKSVIGPFKASLQEELGENINLYQLTPYIRVEQLNQLAQEIWRE
jgi:energy-coupling factor transporter ATP-binding protein EcfA2